MVARASWRRPSSSAATTSTRARSPRPTARPRPCATARTRSPTGRCSTRCSTRPRAPPGSACTTAAGSAWASVCDGTPEAARRIERVLTNDPATGVMRHADAGYPGGHRLRAGAGNLPMLDAMTTAWRGGTGAVVATLLGLLLGSRRRGRMVELEPARRRRDGLLATSRWRWASLPLQAWASGYGWSISSSERL